jgi:hypothetical protein
VKPSTVPLKKPKPKACEFESLAKRDEAVSECSSKFGGQLWDECHFLGRNTFDFFEDTCVENICAGKTTEQSKIAYCALTLLCMDSGFADVDNLYEYECFQFESTSFTTTPTTTATTSATDTPILNMSGSSGSGFESDASLFFHGVIGERRFVWELMLCAILCIVVLILWYVFFGVTEYLERKKAVPEVVMAPAPLARPVDGYLAAAATFDDYGSMSDEAAAAMAAEMQPISNPLYGERIDEVAEEIKTGKAAPGAATKPDPAVNLQDGRDNQYIDLAMFEQEAAFSAHTQQEEEVESKLGKVDEERLALLAALNELPWQDITVEVKDLDITFSLDGHVLRTNRLPEPMQDIHGDGHLVVGQRYPGLHRFTGEMRALNFYESTERVPGPDDPSGRDGRPPRPDAALGTSPINLFVLGDDPNRTVTKGNEEGAKLFDGGYSTAMHVPHTQQPTLAAVERHGVSFKLECSIRQKPGTSGYVVAKTDGSGNTRYWALGIVSEERGTSFQFYYRPKGAVEGHRMTVANIGTFTSATMDPEYVLVGQALEVDQAQKSATAMDRIGAAGLDMLQAGDAESFFQGKVKAEEQALKREMDRKQQEAKANWKKVSAKSNKLLSAASAFAGAGGLAAVASVAADPAPAPAPVELPPTTDPEDEADDRAVRIQAKMREDKLAQFARRKVQLEAIVAAHEESAAAVVAATTALRAKDTQISQMQGKLNSAEVRATRAAARRDEAVAAAQVDAQAKQGQALSALLPPRTSIGVDRATHLSMTPGATPVVPDYEPATGPIETTDVLAMLSLFPDLL